MSTVETAGTCTAILDELERAVVGRRRTLELVLIGILASGHVLLEDLPGLGKTLIARSFARVLGLEFARIQFTPDLLPSDVTGAPLYDQRSAEMVFRPGPVFTQLLLADEINRTPPKTQAALLEAMAEGQVSVDGKTSEIDRFIPLLDTLIRLDLTDVVITADASCRARHKASYADVTVMPTCWPGLLLVAATWTLRSA